MEDHHHTKIVSPDQDQGDIHTQRPYHLLTTITKTTQALHHTIQNTLDHNVLLEMVVTSLPAQSLSTAGDQPQQGSHRIILCTIHIINLDCGNMLSRESTSGEFAYFAKHITFFKVFHSQDIELSCTSSRHRRAILPVPVIEQIY